LLPSSAARARSAYDGSWDPVFVTQKGACDATYNFTVNIANGVVTHPNLVRFRGYVARSGAVRASVTVQDKHASAREDCWALPAVAPGVAIREASLLRLLDRAAKLTSELGNGLGFFDPNL
jgi:hypothetical protein